MRPRTAQHRAASESERGASAHRAAVRAQLNPTPAAKTVLVAEDDLWLRSIMVELLLEEDYRVIEAMDGAEALELAEREGPDVLVLDLRLPWRSGLEVLRRLRAGAKTATMPVIVVSGALDCEARARLARRAERADGVLEKPVDIGRLFDAVEQAAWSAPQPTGSGREPEPKNLEVTPMRLEDKTLTCRHCGNPFIFTTGEQGVRLSRGRNETPTRCPRCERRTGPETPSSFDTMRLTDD